MPGGLTSTGFSRSNLQEIISEIEKDLQDAYNNPKFSVEDNENFGNLVKVLANRESLAWQAMEQIYNVWTLNGAEGVFLDELFALNGIFRSAATGGSGFSVVETNSSAVDSTPIVAGTLFSGSNGVQYSSPETTVVSTRVTAYKVDGSLVGLNTYTFNVTNRVTDELFSQNFTLASSTPAARLTFLQSIQTFLQSVNPSEINVHLDSDNLMLYYGFDEAFELTGLTNTVDMLVSPSVGNRYTLVEAVATVTGFNPLRVGEITSMSILPSGYVSVTNLTAFSSGTDVETDAAFIERARVESDSPRSSTRPAVLSGLLKNIVGIENVKFNKTVTDGVISVNPIIIGGENSDIAAELYRTQPINNIYSGNIAVDVSTEDNDTETIRFSRGVSQNLSIRVTYATTLNTAFTATEVDDIVQNLLDLSEQWQLGSTIFNAQLQSAVFSSTASGRLSLLTVETKKKEDLDTEYSTNNYVAAPNELPILDEVDVQFVQQII